MPRTPRRPRRGATNPWASVAVAIALGASSQGPWAVAAPDLTPETMPRVPAHEPADAARTFELRPGFHAELVAAEPLVQSPVAVAVDESGAAYVVEMRDYSERRPEALGRIRRLTDTDGDGRYDQATVFLDNLPWPTAVTCWDGGVFLGATPDILYAKDTTGDGVADVREVVFTGFADRYAPFATNQLNVQALLNSLQWGPDGRIHGATSASGGTVRRVDSTFTRDWRRRAGDASPTTPPPVPLAGRDFSFDPCTLTLRAEPGGGQHGMTFDDAGRKFVCSNSDHLQWLAYAEQDVPPNPFHDLPGPRRSIAADGPAAEVFRRSPDEPWRVLRTRWRVAGVVEGMIEGGGRPSGYFTGATGVTIYRGDAYGPGFLGDAFIADCGSNLIHRKKLRRQTDGSGWVGERASDEARREFLASTDNWFRPVQFYNAPDGCLWVVDMYRETIEHPWSIPPNLKRNLDLDSGRTRGRLWRLAPDASPRGRGLRTVDRKAPTPELVALLGHANSWHRDLAARLLAERKDPAAIPALRRQGGEGPAPARRQALALLKGANALDVDTLRRATQDPDDVVRRQAFQAIRHRPSEEAATWREVLVTAAARETDEEVQLAIAFALGSVPAPPASRLPGLAPLLGSRSALVRSAALHAAADAELALWTDRVGDARPDVPPTLRDLTSVLGRRARAEEVGPILRRLRGIQPDETARSLLATLAEGLARAGHRLADFLPPDELAAWMDPARASAGSHPTEATLRLLAWDPSEASGRRLLSVWATAADPLAATALAALRQHPSLLTNGAALRDAWAHAPVARRTPLADLWLRHPDGARTLLAAATPPDRAIDPTTWSPGQVAALRNHPNMGVREAARRLLGEPPASRQAVVEQFAPALSQAGRAAHGEQVFRERCATCHAFKGQGIALGPDLASVAANGPEKLLVAILDPNREVAPNFAAWSLETTDGETVSGIQVRESAANVTLRVAGGAESTVERARIRSLETTGRSLMPEGLEQGWQPQDLADLLAFLAGGSTGPDGAGATSKAGWSTIAGTGRRATEPASTSPAATTLATNTDLASPFGLVRGPDGALWFCEFDGHRIRRLDAQGQLTTIAGTGRAGYSGDGGPAVAATLNQPHELRFDRAGLLYVTDTGNHVIRRIDPRTGRITTHAGTGEAGYSGDGGPATRARLNSPISLQFSPDGDLFVCDIGNHVVRRVDGRTGALSTFAGTGVAGPTPDGSPIRGTPIRGPRSIDFDAHGDPWLVTREGNQLFRLDRATGRFHLQAGTGKAGFTGNGGPGTSATLGGPKGVAVGADGQVYLADTENHAIRRLDPRSGSIDVVAGDGVAGDGSEGDGRKARLRRPHGIWVEADGTLLVGDSDNHRIRRIPSHR